MYWRNVTNNQPKVREKSATSVAQRHSKNSHRGSVLSSASVNSTTQTCSAVFHRHYSATRFILHRRRSTSHSASTHDNERPADRSLGTEPAPNQHPPQPRQLAQLTSRGSNSNAHQRSTRSNHPENGKVEL